MLGPPACNDPRATNFAGTHIVYDHSCTYSFAHGSLDFSHDDTQNGHVSVRHFLPVFYQISTVF